MMQFEGADVSEIKNKKISNTASTVGLSETTLRKYESQGVIAPRRYNSGYRYYDYLDISRIMTCRKYRQYDYSVDEAVKLMDLPDLSDLEYELRKNEERYAKELKWREYVLRDMRNTIDSIVEFQRNESVFRFERIPEMLFVEGWASAEKIPIDNRKAIKKIVDYIPLAKVTVFGKISENGMFKKTNSGYSIFADEAQQLDLTPSQHISVIPGHDCLAVYTCCTADRVFLTQTLPSMQSFAIDRGKKPTGELLMHTWACLGMGENMKAYRKIWLKIE